VDGGVFHGLSFRDNVLKPWGMLKNISNGFKHIEGLAEQREYGNAFCLSPRKREKKVFVFFRESPPG
jgi:hypothetical protein